MSEVLSNVKDTNPKDLVGQTKAQMWLIPPAAKVALAEALMDGASKYQPYNWREKGVRASVYLAAAERHAMAFLDGEDVAADSLVHHLGHAMACYAILLDAIAQGNVVDDRPVKGHASRLLSEVHTKNEYKKAKAVHASALEYPFNSLGYLRDTHPDDHLLPIHID
jgi:hypothetical protein